MGMVTIPFEVNSTSLPKRSKQMPSSTLASYWPLISCARMQMLCCPS